MAKLKPLSLTRQDVEKILEVCAHDGHSIVSPVEFGGINPEFIKRMTFIHKSSKGDPKWMISTSAGPVKELTGIYTLSALQAACNILGLSTEAGRFYGRGRQATAYTEALQNWVKAQAAV